MKTLKEWIDDRIDKASNEVVLSKNHPEIAEWFKGYRGALTDLKDFLEEKQRL